MVQMKNVKKIIITIKVIQNAYHVVLVIFPMVGQNTVQDVLMVKHLMVMEEIALIVLQEQQQITFMKNM